ncbi:MAG: phosphate acyltransferase, partial [Clostridia bacterium]|nr:phosphate acyltransferase [Clostridia bacterium]
MKLVIDCLGGDNSPGANVEGSLIALDRFPGLELILAGDEETLKKELEKHGAGAD